MNKRISVLASILAITLSVSCLTACGSNTTNTSSNSIEKSAGSKGVGVDGFSKFNKDGEAVDGAVDNNDVNGAEIDAAEDIADAGMGDADAVGNGEAYIDDSESAMDTDSENDKIGVLTAGEWNDNTNWGFFTNLVKNNKIEIPTWCPNICNRVKVEVKNTSGNAVTNETVSLYNKDGSIIWTSITNKDGIAYLFDTDKDVASKVVASDGTESSLDEVDEDTQSNNNKTVSNREVQLIIGKDTDKYSNMQIQFIVDTTGSMGDEMIYLQSDFMTIADEVGVENKEFSTVFYRDEGDDYVVKANPFTSNTQDIILQLYNESAGGGGDEPEAVSDALDSAFNEIEWRDDTVKIAFMIFDAPPHTDDESVDKLNKAISIASEKGIHIVPVVSSNSNRTTELFGRTLAIATNGTYVFLTDDSGVGDSHLEPIIGDYEVEKLHDIIVRVINDYSQDN